MALHFSTDEYATRRARLSAAMKEQDIDAMFLFSPESHYWLTGFDTFGFCFFQCLIFTVDGEMALLTRSADLRQARHTSNIDTIVIWPDRANADPTRDLKDLADQFDLLGKKVGIEYNSHGLVASNGRKLDARFESYCDLIDGSGIVPKLRAVKSEEELLFVTKAGEISDEAFLAAKPLIKAGADEGEILSAMQGTVFALGGDYPGNEFIIGSGRDALLCRYKSGRSKLDANDQLTLEWSGAWRRYHAPMMRTVLTGKPQKRHLELYEAAAEALTAVESAMIADNTFGDVFEAHRAVMDKHGLMRHRLNACGYSVGATFTPSWMDMPMFFEDNPEPIVANMSLFAHMIIMDSDTDCAMTLGRTYITGDGPPRSLSTLELDLVIA